MELMTTYNISLDLVKSNYVVVKAKQYDKNSRKIIVHCTLNGEEYRLFTGVKAIAQMKKPDGKVVSVNCDVDLDKNAIIINMTEQMTVVTGVVTAEIVLISVEQEAVLSTMTFNIIVNGSTITREQLMSSDEFKSIADIMYQYENVLKTIEVVEGEMVSWVEQERVRVANENIRKNNETSRNIAEGSRNDNESHRQVNEENRIVSENTRRLNEDDRVANESEREIQESSRQYNESLRISAEEHRIANEAVREQNELARSSAEEKRENDTYAAIDDVNAVKDEITRKLANGEFDGRTVLYGSGVPSNSHGKSGDIYVNVSYTEPYPFYLFTKDENGWNPVCMMRGIDGTDTLPLLGTMFLPSNEEIPIGYEEVAEPAIPSSLIMHDNKSLNLCIEELLDRIEGLEEELRNAIALN